MIKTILCLAFSVLPATLAAQGPSLAQLGRLAETSVSVPVVLPAATQAPVQAKNTLLLLDPRTGKVDVVIPTGGGFIYAATGKFVPAVFNGSGYIMPDGQYRPVVGGRQARAVAAPSVKAGKGLSGKWTGWGEWTYQGSGAHCFMDMSFEDGAEQLSRMGGYFDCSVVALNVEPAKFLKKGTRLLDESGAEVGSYEGGVIILNESYSADVDIKTTIKVSGLHFDYSEVWRLKKDGSELYNITGRLFTGG